MKARKSSSYKPILTIIILIVLAVVFFLGSRENSVTVTEQSIKISGMYGVVIDTNDIQLVELRENAPRIIYKINAIDIPFLKKGTFRLEEFKSARLFVHSTSGPFLIIISDSDTIIMSFKDPGHTLNIYNEIQTVMLDHVR
jgi:hypothetical protein